MEASRGGLGDAGRALRRSIESALYVAGLASSLVGCVGPDGLPMRTPDIDGYVTEVVSQPNSVTLTVEERSIGGAGGRRALVRLTERTKVMKDVGGVYPTISP